MSARMPSSGTITLRQIHDLWVSQGVTGYYNLLSYRGGTYTADGFNYGGQLSSGTLTIETFYGIGPYVTAPPPAPPPDPGPGPVGK